MSRPADPDKPLKLAQAAARLNIAYKDLTRLDRPWTRRDVMRGERPVWLTQARRDYAAGQDEKAERERRVRSAPRCNCLCCGAEFAFEIESGGLCDACNDGECPACGGDDGYG